MNSKSCFKNKNEKRSKRFYTRNIICLNIFYKIHSRFFDYIQMILANIHFI